MNSKCYFWHLGGNTHLKESFKHTKKIYKQREEGRKFTNLEMIVNKHKSKHQMPRQQV